MTEKKLDPMQELHGEYRNEAMVYLYYENQTPLDFLAEATHLAYSTVKNYVLYKFKDLLEKAKELFRKAKNILRKAATDFYCYIDKITLQNGKTWCKIGQTTQTPEKRAQSIKSTGWEGKTIIPKSVEVQHVIKCKDATAMQNMEDCLRLGMTAINPDEYQPNDRLLSWEEDYPQRILANDFVQMGLARFAA